MKHRKRAYIRSLSFFFTICWLYCTLAFPLLADGQALAADVPPEAPKTSAKAVLLMEAVCGDELYAVNADEPLPVASTTKIMTAILAIEKGNLDKTVAVPAMAVGIEGSSAYLYEGEKLTLQSLLYALMLQSANDAAVTVAVNVSGSVEKFVDEMNRKAKALGMEHTHFANPNGLPDENHYSTARDMARLAAYALKNDTFSTIVSTYKKTVTSDDADATRVFINHNKLLRTYDGIIGIKTGYTKTGGRCLVSAARRNGVTLVCVTLNDPNDWRDHTDLLDWGFSRSASHVALEKGALTMKAGIVGSDATDDISVTNASAISYITTDNKELSVTDEIRLPGFLYAPVKKGQCVGEIIYYRGEKEIGRSDLVATQDIRANVRKRGFFGWLERLFSK